MSQPHAWPHEQPAGLPLVEPVDPAGVDALRKRTFTSYESFLRERLMQFDRERAAQWSRNYRDQSTYLASIEPMRRRFADMLGFWTPPAQRPAIAIDDEQTLLETDEFTASRFMFEALPGLWSYAMRLAPRKPCGAGLVIQHGYLATPELVCGFTAKANNEDYAYRSVGIRAAQRGYHVIAPHHPSGYGTLSDVVDAPLPGFANQSVHYGKNRLHRLCVLGGGTLLGLDMFVSSRAVDLLAASPGVDSGRIGAYGLSRGGQTSLYLPALDTRVRASVCSAYFNTRLAKLIGPYPRTNYVDWFGEEQILPELVEYFADSDLASLIAPRAFAVEAGVLDTSVDHAAAYDEFPRAAAHYHKLGIPDRIEFISHAGGHVSATARAFAFLDYHLS